MMQILRYIFHTVTSTSECTDYDLLAPGLPFLSGEMCLKSCFVEMVDETCGWPCSGYTASVEIPDGTHRPCIVVWVHRYCHCTNNNTVLQGPDSVQGHSVTRIGNPIIKMKRSWDRLIIIMRIAALVRLLVHIESAPDCIMGYHVCSIIHFHKHLYGRSNINLQSSTDHWTHDTRHIEVWIILSIHFNPSLSPPCGPFY